MKKLLLCFMGALASFAALADDATANFTTNVATYCTVGQMNPGILHLSNSTVTTDTPAIMQVNSNEANKYKIRATNAGDFDTKPNGYTGTATLTTTMDVSGSNNGNVAVGAEMPLAASGVNTVEVSVAGSTDTDVIAGDYTASAVVSCIAQ
ncbi:hypothetical protein [Vibrio phage vB_VhaS-tm]|nr:hypothetical protein [Vibrio phage vB_VhaS-tm]